MPEWRIIAPGKLPFQKDRPSLPVKLRGPKLPVRSKLLYRILTERGREVRKGTADASSSTIYLRTGALPIGKYFAELRLLSKEGNVLAFAVHDITVSGDDPIKSLHIERAMLNKGLLRTQIELDPGSVSHIEVQLEDIHHRVVLRTQLAVSEPELTFSFPLPPSIVTRLHYLIVTALKGGRRVSAREEIISIPVRKTQSMHYVMWHSCSATFTAYAMNRYIAERFGVNEVYAPSAYGALVSARSKPPLLRQTLYPPATLPNLHNQIFVPYIIPVLYRGKELERQPCISNPDYRQFFRSVLGVAVDFMYGNAVQPPFYSLGDEFVLTFPYGPDVCFSKWCLQKFRKSLKQKYRTLNKLNEFWGTSFKRWQDVRPLTLDEAKEKDQSTRWFDHRLFMDSVIIELIKEARDRVRKSDPNAIIGFEGMFRSYSECGYDLERIAELCQFLVSYEYPYRWEMLRDFSGPEAVVGVFSNTMGGLPGGTQYQVWKAVFHGLNSIWWWRLSGDSGILAFDLSAGAKPLKYKNFVIQSKNIKEIRNGLGALLQNAVRTNQQVAILHSQHSLHAVKLYGKARDLSDSWTSFQCLLEDLGVGYRYLKSSELMKNGLSPGKVKVLVLPHCLSLPARLIEVLKCYVQEGGTLLADIRPAMLDEHARWTGRGLLDDVFGIRMSQPTELAKTHSKFGELTVDASVTALNPEEAMAFAGKTPVLICHKSGRGTALLLNFKITDYAPPEKVYKPDFSTNPTIRRLIRELLPSLRGPVGIDSESAVATPGFEIFTYRLGDTTLIAILRKFYGDTYVKLPDEHTLYLPSEGFLYDVRAHAYLGHRKSVRFKCLPGEAKLLALLPYKPRIRKLEASFKTGADPTIFVRGEMERGAENPRFVLQFRIFAPGGRELRYYQKTLSFSGTAFSTTVPLSLNPPEGSWEIIATEVISGQKKSTKITLRR